MCYDRRRNSIWIASPDGLLEFNLNTRKFNFPEAFRPIVNQKDFGHWAGISLDSHGRIWIATFPRGISIYDPGNQTLTIPFPKNDSLQKITAKDNLFLYCDRDGMVWTGSWNRNGINQLIPFTPSSHRYSPGVELAFNPISRYGGPTARFADGGRC
jgi:ligand-binding sensor domain-containing protein